MASPQNMILLLSPGALVIGVFASLFITLSVSSTVTHLVDGNEKMVQGDITQIRSDTEGVAAKSLDIKELALEMAVNSAALADLVQPFKFKDATFDTGKIKAAHFSRKMRLTSGLNGYEKLDELYIS